MVEYQTSINFTLHVEGDKLVLTLYNRPSYGVNEIKNILEGALPGIEVVPTERRPGNVFLLVPEDQSPKALRAARQVITQALQDVKEVHPDFERIHDPLPVAWGNLDRTALAR